jgi:hypothetical protein
MGMMNNSGIFHSDFSFTNRERQNGAEHAKLISVLSNLSESSIQFLVLKKESGEIISKINWKLFV